LTVMELEVKDWALRCVEGSIISYTRGRIPLNMAVGRIRRALNSYGLKMGEVLALMDAIESSPVYLPTLSKAEKSARLEQVKEALTGLRAKPQSTVEHLREGGVIHG
jgi:hypothetical protein